MTTTMVRIKPDGTEEKITVTPVAPRSDEAVTEAALRDPDAQPVTEADLARMKRVPRVKTLRRALGLTRENLLPAITFPLAPSALGNRGVAHPINRPAPISPSSRTTPKASNAPYKRGHTERLWTLRLILSRDGATRRRGW